MSVATSQDGPIKPLSTFDQTVRLALGNDVRISESREGYAHSTTGIPHAIHGKATLVEQKVGLHLASFNDPIKALLGTGIHRDEKIIIRRKFVIGQSATITPERAPARTVAIKEDTREVSLVRYGADIEMNLNLFLRPEDAQEELDMKVDAQKGELERELVNIGYRTLLDEGTELVSAIMKSNPGFSDTGPHGAQHQREAQHIQNGRIFGALNKFDRPIASLLAACRYATAYACGTQRGSLLIVPHGAPDILRYARPSQMEYSVTGIKQSDGKKITMDMENVYEDPASGVKIAIQYPMPSYTHGAAHAHTTQKNSPLTREITIVECFENKTGGSVWLTNLQTGDMVEIETSGTAGHKSWIYRATKVIASSAILGAPGSNTGELLYAYPSTGCSTSHTQEQMMIQLRVYLGAALYQPENVLILRDVLIESVSKCNFCARPDAAAAFQATAADFFADIQPLGQVTGDPYFDAVANGWTTDLNAIFGAGNAADCKDNYDRITKKLKMLAPTFTMPAFNAGWGDANAVADPISVAFGTAIQATTTANAYDDDRKARPGNSEFSAFGVMDHPTRYTSLNGAPHMFNMSKASFDN